METDLIGGTRRARATHQVRPVGGADVGRPDCRSARAVPFAIAAADGGHCARLAGAAGAEGAGTVVGTSAPLPVGAAGTGPATVDAGLAAVLDAVGAGGAPPLVADPTRAGRAIGFVLLALTPLAFLARRARLLLPGRRGVASERGQQASDGRGHEETAGGSSSKCTGEGIEAVSVHGFAPRE